MPVYIHVLAGLLFLAAGTAQLVEAARCVRPSARITRWVLGTAMVFHSITYYLIN